MENISCKVLDKISASFVPLGLTRHGFLKTHRVLLWLIQLLIFNNLCPYKLITFLKHACMCVWVCLCVIPGELKPSIRRNYAVEDT